MIKISFRTLCPLVVMLYILLLSSCTSDGETSYAYIYCVYSADTFCAQGPFTTCQGNGVLSNTCPYPSSSSLGGVSSSSVLQSSSSTVEPPNVVYGTPITYEGETYQTVVIGTQTWMARNLNYNVSGSRCGNDNCATYGRFYEWITAMALTSQCHDQSCTPEKRGICPSGWHIPSGAEWNTLTNFVGSSTAGIKLKATSGWNEGGNGTDAYGFAALPGGTYAHFYDFDYKGNVIGHHGVGNYSEWWTSSIVFGIAGYKAYTLQMDYNRDNVSTNNGADQSTGTNYGRWLNVRCVQD